MKILVLIESLKINNHSGAVVGINYIDAIVKNNQVHVLYPNEIVANMPNSVPKFIGNVWVECFDILPSNLYENIIGKILKIRAFAALLFGVNLQKERWIRSWRKAIEEQMAKKDYGLILILGVGTVFASHFAMEMILTKIPWAVYIHDSFPTHHYPKPYQTRSTFVNQAEYHRFDKMLSKATFVGFPLLRLKEWMQQYHTVIEGKSFISLHAAYDDELLNGVALDDKILLDQAKFNLLYTGSLLGHRDSKWLIEAFERFINDDSEKKELANLYILGAISNNFLTTSDSTNNIHLINERYKHAQTLMLLKSVTVLILLETTEEESSFIPGKLSDYIKNDRPILALTPKRSEISRILGDECKHLSEVDDTGKIHQLLDQLWLEWKSKSLQSFNRLDLQKYIGHENQNYILQNLLK